MKILRKKSPTQPVAGRINIRWFDQNDYSGFVAYLSFSIFTGEFMLQFEFFLQTLMSFDRKVLLVYNI
jgi:hypothetical protein